MGFGLLVSPAKKSMVGRHSVVGVLVVELLHAGILVSGSVGMWELYLSHGIDQHSLCARL